MSWTELGTCTAVTLTAFKALLAAGAVTQTTVFAWGNQYLVTFRAGTESFILTAQRKHARAFRDLNTVSRFLYELGVRQLQLDLTGCGHRDEPMPLLDGMMPASEPESNG